MRKEKIVTLTFDGCKELFWIKTTNCYRLLDERELARRIPGYSNLNDKAREKQKEMYLSEAKIIVWAEVPLALPNTQQKLRTEPRRHPNESDYEVGTSTFFRLSELFQKSEGGFALICNILGGLCCQALREAEPSFRPVLNIPTIEPKLIELFIAIVRSVVTRKKWSGKHCKLKRVAILDYRDTNSMIGCHIQDFSEVTVKVKKNEDITVPLNYNNTVVVVVGANSAQLREAEPYLENACVFLIGCAGTSEWKAEKLSADSVLDYNPEILDLLRQHHKEVAAVLYAWWAAEKDEMWARNMVAKAKATFGKPDSKYVAVSLNPRKLRREIQYQVLQSFFAWVEQLGWISTEALAPYRQSAKDVFDPDPIVETPVRRAEDPEVFIELIRQLACEYSDKILLENDIFVNGNKKVGAYRTFSGKRYLILLEEAFALAYAKLARKAGDIDISFLKRKEWERGIQKIMSQSGVIKEASSGYRYRYGLYGSNEDKVYVLAIACHFLA